MQTHKGLPKSIVSRWTGRLGVVVLALVLALLGVGTALAGQGPGSLAAPSPNPFGAQNKTHWKVQAGTTITGTIQGATDVSTSTVNVIIKSSIFGNTTVIGTRSGTTITFQWSVPVNGVCGTTIVAYGTNGNNTNNALLPGGSGKSAAGFAIVDASGKVIPIFTNPFTGTKQCTAPEKKTPSVTTEIHLDGDHSTAVISVALASTVHDQATVTGSGPAPTGTVDFTFFTSGDCSTGAVPAGSVALDGSGLAHPSSSQGPLAAGSYSFRAHYNGDTNYLAADSACEPLRVNQGDTTVSTEVHDPNHTNITGGSVPLGTAIHDQATVSGEVSGFPITGTVTYQRFNTIDCTGSSADETVAVGNESTPVTLGAGSYSYKAFYNGDSNYGASVDSVCEPLTVEQGTPSVVTEIHLDGDHSTAITSAPIGASVHDQATVSGSLGTPTGTVSFTVFDNQSCWGTGTDAGTVSLDSSGVAHPSNSATVTSSGLSFRGHYNGDPNYTEADSPCEPLEVEDTTQPNCEWRVVPGLSPRTARATITDSGSGIVSIEVLKLVNATLEIPDGSGNFYNQGDIVTFATPQAEVIVEAVKIVAGQGSTVSLRVKDAAGNDTGPEAPGNICDPDF